MARAARSWFSVRERAILESVAEVVLPPVEGLPAAAGIADRVERYFDDAGGEGARSLRLLLRVLEHGTGLRAFTKRPREEREEVVRRWARSRSVAKRWGLHALVVLVTCAFTADPRVEEALGYVPPRRRLGLDPS